MRPRTAVGWALCAFASALPLSIAGANAGWVLVLLALLWQARSAEGPRWAASRTPLLAPLVVYAATTVVCDLFGNAPQHSLRYLNQDLHKLLLGIILPLAFSLERPKALTLCLAAGGAVIAAIGISQAAWTLGGAPWDRVRAHAFVHPVTYGEQVSILLLGTFAALRSDPAPPGHRKPPTWVLAGILTGALFFSNTRGAMLACVAGAAAMFFSRPGGRKAALWLVVSAMAAYFAMDFMREDRFVTLDALREFVAGRAPAGPSFARMTLWDVALRMGLDHPWTGVGVNNYRALLPHYYRGVFEDLSTSWGTAHNLYLHHFAERGLLGLCSLALLLGAMTLRAVERVRRRPDFWSLWALGTTVAFLVMNLTEVALQTEMVWMLVWTIWFAAEADTKPEAA